MSINPKNTKHRHIWTCGRYNAEKHIALMYNLLAGYSYFFESYSADVIGEVLAVPRNGKEKDYTIKGQMVLP